MLTHFANPLFALLTTLAIINLLVLPLGPLPALRPLLLPVGGFWSAGRGGISGILGLDAPPAFMPLLPALIVAFVLGGWTGAWLKEATQK
ncbi:MAG: hypothetical protein ACP5QU_08030 [Anaerolineae bacterium]